MKTLFLLGCLVFTTIYIQNVNAAVWYVDNESACIENCGTNWETAFNNIQSAVDNATNDDEIWAKKGTYNIFSQIIVNKELSIIGGFNGNENDKSQRDLTTNVTKIDGQGTAYHCFYVINIAVIDGFYITGGNAYDMADMSGGAGGGIYAYEKITVSNCTFDNNKAVTGGGVAATQDAIIINCGFTRNSARDLGGAIVSSQKSSISGSVFFLNTSSQGGAVYLSGGFSSNQGEVLNCFFTENTAGSGGAMVLGGSGSNGTFIIDNCTFSKNTAVDNGGGIDAGAVTATFMKSVFLENKAGNGSTGKGGGVNSRSGIYSINNCMFSGNSATEYGGGINSDGTYGGNILLKDCTFLLNKAWLGGGLHIKSNAPIIERCVFSKNTASIAGGGIRSYGSNPTITKSIFSENNALNQGGGFSGSGLPTIDNCTFIYNKTTSKTYSGLGGGFFNEGTANITKSIFKLNSSNLGGGIYNWYGTPSIVNCLVIENSAKNGGGIFTNYCTPKVINCTISKNQALGTGGGLHIESTGDAKITNCILWGNAAKTKPELGDYNATLTVIYCDINQDGFSGYNGNIRQDPLFAYPINGNYKLNVGSPCIDAGTDNSAPNNDIEGVLRPQGNGYDMGAYESASLCDLTSICGQVTDSATGSPKPDVTIKLYVPSCGGDSLVGQTTTNSQGYYNVTGLGTNYYKVVPEKTGCTFTPAMYEGIVIPKTGYASHGFTAACQ